VDDREPRGERMKVFASFFKKKRFISVLFCKKEPKDFHS
jgi:hypothetical protein